MIAARILLGEKPQNGMAAARDEARQVVFPIVEEALERARLKPEDIDVLIVNCSLFVPTPSLAAMVHSHFGLRSDCKTYNLGGMGCSASLIGIDLAKELLQCHPGWRALVVSTENLSQQLYLGKEKSMLVQNMLFRCGGAAIVLSSRLADGFTAKYKLLYTQRTQISSEEALGCVWQCEDSSGHKGVYLSKDVPRIAGQALKHNLTAIGPYVLPVREQASVLFREAVRWVHRRLVNLGSASGIKFLAELPRPSPYIPDFKQGLQYFCIHAGGRAVIDGVQENLKLSAADAAASKACLDGFGNTSSSSVWYELRFCEQEDESWIAKDAGAPLGPGDRVLQIAFGSGFKCNSAVWLRMR
jgi:predicted naringenin-chalcone synthase